MSGKHPRRRRRRKKRRTLEQQQQPTAPGPIALPLIPRTVIDRFRLINQRNAHASRQ